VQTKKSLFISINRLTELIKILIVNLYLRLLKNLINQKLKD
jgi:hypothetical protein